MIDIVGEVGRAEARIRPHIRIFVNTRETATLAAALAAGDEVHLICALSGG